MIRRAWIIAAIGLTILGCYFLGPPPPPTPPNPDTLPDWNYFDAPDCISACWSDLRPGQTTEEELIEHYQKQGIQEEGIEYGTFMVYRAFSEEGMVIGDVYTKDGILFGLDLDAGNLELSTILAVLGEPEGIELRYETSVASDTLSDIELTAFYPSDGFIFYFDIRSGLHGEQLSGSEVSICIDDRIVPIHVYVFESGSIEEIYVRQVNLYHNAEDIGEDSILNFTNSLTSWLGLGCHTISK